jgi:hypothetical protein
VKKRTFLLLEILIALSLATLCIVPFVKQPLFLYKKELAALEQIEKERLADWTFTEIEEMFLKNEIPRSEIPDKGENSIVFSLPDAHICIPNHAPKVIHRTFYIKTRGDKGASRQLGIYVHLDNDLYSFRLPILLQT